jgi:hypothetical protein
VASLRLTGILLAALLALVGLIWIGQGLGYIKGSFMTGQAFWAEVGLLSVAAAFTLAAVSVVAGRRRQP